MNHELLLYASGVSKRYGPTTALEALDLDVGAGEFIGLLGVNGSGKSTILKLAAGLILPSAGRLEVLGMTPGVLSRLQVAYMPEHDNLYPGWHADDAFEFLRRFFPVDEQRYRRLLAFLQIDPRARFASLSKGNRTRMRLALTLAREARLYLLDEPLSGIDPLTREQILRALIGEIPASSAVMLATHQVSEAESLLDRVLVLHHGQVLLQGRADDIRRQFGTSIDRALKDATLAASARRQPAGVSA